MTMHESMYPDRESYLMAKNQKPMPEEPSAKENLRGTLIDFLDELREYIHESGNNLVYDECESFKFVDIYLQMR